MNLRSRLLIISVLILGVLASPAVSASAGATRITVTGQELWIADVSDVGNYSFPDGNLHGRGLQSIYNNVSSDPRLSGIDTVTINFNFRPALPPAGWTGPMWGTFHIENAGGVWDGTWTGERTRDGFAFIHAVGQGRGAYQGLHVTFDIQRLSPDPTAPSTYSGHILETGNN